MGTLQFAGGGSHDGNYTFAAGAVLDFGAGTHVSRRRFL